MVKMRIKALRISIVLLVVLGLTFGAAGCGKQEPKVVKLGAVVTSMTGPAALNGEYIQNSIKTAVEEINAKGGIKGKKIEVVYLDDQTKASEGINAVKKLIYEEQVLAILGPDYSSVVLPSMDLAKQGGVPMVVSATNPKITSSGNEWMFRMRGHDGIEAAALVEYAVKEKKFQKFGIFYTNNDYGKGGQQAVEGALAKYNLKPVAVESHNVGDVDFTAQILKFKNANPDAIIMWGVQTELAKFAKQMREMGIQIPFLGGSAVTTSWFIDLVGAKNWEGAIATSHFLPTDPDPVIQEWVKKYQSKYGKVPDDHTSPYYDTVYMIAKVIEDRGVTGELKKDRQNIRDGLAAIKGYKGVQSMYNTQPSGDMVVKKVIGQFKDGKWVVIGKVGQ